MLEIKGNREEIESIIKLIHKTEIYDFCEMFKFPCHDKNVSCIECITENIKFIVDKEE